MFYSYFPTYQRPKVGVERLEGFERLKTEPKKQRNKKEKEE